MSLFKNTLYSWYTKTITIMVLLCWATYAIAQDSAQKIQKSLFVHASGFYDFPQSFGFTAGVDFVVHSTQKNITRRNGKTLQRTKDRIVNADIGLYRYSFNHTGLMFMPTIGTRYTKQGGYYFETQAGIGLLRTFYDGRVYEVDGSGNVKEKKAFGRYYTTTQLALVFGYDFSKCTHLRPIAIQLKPILWVQYPYNSFLLPHGSLELGIKYHFNRFNTRVGQTIKTKNRKK
jgi:hypothetical protein